MDGLGPRARYTRIAMLLHWGVAVLMIGNLALGWGANYVPDTSVRAIIDAHKSVGLTVFGLVVLRLSWRLGNPPPALPRSMGRAERWAAGAAHALLYGLMFALPITGWLHDSAWKQAPSTPLRWFGLFTVPRLGAIMAMPADHKEALHSRLFALHLYLGYALAALVVVHVLGALKHQFVDRQPELQRMLS